MKRVVVAVLGVLPLFIAATAQAGTLYVNVCGSYSRDQGPLQASSSLAYVVVPSADCGAGGHGLDIGFRGYGVVPHNANAAWQTSAPPGIAINHIHVVGAHSRNIGDGKGWWGEFYWKGGPGVDGRSGQLTDSFGTYGCCSQSFDSRSIGWFIACGWASGCSSAADLDIYELQLTATESAVPTVYPKGPLWTTKGWIRGVMNLTVAASDPSGICSASVVVGGQVFDAANNLTPNRDAWQQCPNLLWSRAIDTRGLEGNAGLGEGSMLLGINAGDAAGNNTGFTYTKELYVDNVAPTVTLTGPHEASSATGTQYITATATAGPSGVSGIWCRVDGAPYQWHPGSITRIPVSGAGQHSITCVSANNARDAGGNLARSAPSSWAIAIRQPTVVAVALTRVTKSLRCHKVRVRMHRARRNRVVRVTRCRRLRQVVGDTTRRVAHGHRARVSGWLGTTTGVALGGQQVQVLTAPDNGLVRFRVERTVATAPNGTWSATLPPGPSRLIAARYGGGAITEPSVSGLAHLIVPAKVELLRVSPRHVPWGGTIRIVGRLVGGYLPSGGALVRLRIGTGPAYSTYGVEEHVGGSGRFATTYTFGVGSPGIHRSFWFQIASLPMGDYPYAPAASRRAFVEVGGHP